jgi:hypothetical protein
VSGRLPGDVDRAQVAVLVIQLDLVLGHELLLAFRAFGGS